MAIPLSGKTYCVNRKKRKGDHSSNNTKTFGKSKTLEFACSLLQKTYSALSLDCRLKDKGGTLNLLTGRTGRMKGITLFLVVACVFRSCLSGQLVCLHSLCIYTTPVLLDSLLSPSYVLHYHEIHVGEDALSVDI